MSKKWNSKQRRIIKKAFEGVDREAFAKRLDISRLMVRLIATGLDKVSAKRAIKIEHDFGVPKNVLRPDIFD